MSTATAKTARHPIKNPTASNSKRNPRIDCLKGALILFVIAGHLLAGPIRESFPRYLIYSFHMPVFIALSGFLCKPRKLLDTPLPGLLKKYGKRVFFPWLVAVQVFWLINHFGASPSLRDYVSTYWDIYFHLWYIPGFLCYVFLSRLFLEWFSGRGASLEKALQKLVILSALVSLAFCIWYLLPLEDGTRAARIQYLVYHDFHLLYWIYFTLGMYVSTLRLDASGVVFNGNSLAKAAATKNTAGRAISCPFLLAMACFFASLYIFLYFYDYPALEHAVKFCFNTVLILYLFSGFRGVPTARQREKSCDNKNLSIQNDLLQKDRPVARVSALQHKADSPSREKSLFPSFLTYIGRHSLAFYLYVQVGKSITARFLSFSKEPAAFTLAELILSLVSFLVIVLMLRVPFLRKTIFGENS